ncbi:MAG: response regulator transcription factor [Verrucomicrobia bacterium]|nr:response regulator transcription factor [Verrucomicrobiota bacterium]
MEQQLQKQPPPTLRVLITEDHASTRMGIKHILEEGFPSLCFGEAADEAGTLALLAQQAWDLLILDISLPGRSGVEVLREVKQQQPNLPVLVYSAHRENEFAMHMLRAGAGGYLTKERAPEDLCRAVQQVLTGGTYLSENLSQRLLGAMKSGGSVLLHENLTPREFQVLRLIVAGKTGKEVAEELGLSQKTISSFRTRILNKLRLGSTAELIQYAMRERLF